VDTESSYVVSLISPLPAADASVAAAEVAPRLAVPRDRLARLLTRGTGALTQSLDYAAASRIATVLSAAGVPVRVTGADDPHLIAPETWPEFGPTELDEEISSVAWMAGAVHDDGARRPEDETRRQEDRSPDRSHAGKPAPFQQLHRAPESDDRAEDFSDGPVFDWNQPLGMARSRTPLPLVALAAALAVFVPF
jgi:hypothetical protein